MKSLVKKKENNISLLQLRYFLHLRKNLFFITGTEVLTDVNILLKNVVKKLTINLKYDIILY